MATVKQYETMVKKLRETPPSSPEYAELGQQKKELTAALHSQATSRQDKRKLKLTLDEINNS